MADERIPGVDQDRELFGRIAETHPGIVRTLDVLVAELRAADLDPALMRLLGDRIRRIGTRVTTNADRMVIESDGADQG